MIDAVAITQDEPNAYTVKGILKAVAAEGTGVSIVASSGCEIEGETMQGITRPGEVVWEKVTTPGSRVTITVTRSDNGASSVISIVPGPAADFTLVDGQMVGGRTTPAAPCSGKQRSRLQARRPRGRRG